jgi:hypothetical protein
MKNAVHSLVHTLQDTCHLGRHVSTRLFRQNLTVSSNLHYYVKKQVQLLSLLSMNKYIVFIQFLIKDSVVKFLYSLQHYLHH